MTDSKFNKPVKTPVYTKSVQSLVKQNGPVGGNLGKPNSGDPLRKAPKPGSGGAY